MFPFLTPCTAAELLCVYENDTQPERSLQELLPESKLSLLKTISVKNRHPVCFPLLLPGSRKYGPNGRPVRHITHGRG